MAFSTQGDYERALGARVKRIRVEGGWTQEGMAIALGIPVARYKNYETRSPLPAYLIERFASVTGREISYIVAGTSEARRRGPRRNACKTPLSDQQQTGD